MRWGRERRRRCVDDRYSSIVGARNEQSRVLTGYKFPLFARARCRLRLREKINQRGRTSDGEGERKSMCVVSRCRWCLTARLLILLG